MTYKEIIAQVAKELELPEELVEKTYKAFFLFIRVSIQTLPLKENISEEEFEKLKTSFNVPSLGKFSCTYDRMNNVKKRFEYIRKLKTKLNEHKED